MLPLGGVCLSSTTLLEIGMEYTWSSTECFPDLHGIYKVLWFSSFSLFPQFFSFNLYSIILLFILIEENFPSCNFLISLFKHM